MIKSMDWEPDGRGGEIKKITAATNVSLSLYSAFQHIFELSSRSERSNKRVSGVT